MVTSDAYPPPPAWAAAAGGKAAVARAIASPWTLEDPERAFVAAHAETPDDQPGEGNYAGLGVTFPHTITSARALRATPVGDHLLLALAREAVRAAAAEARPLLLAISLSSHDYVAHTFGPHSWEEWSELWRLDRELASFFAFLDGVYGHDGWAAMLTGDHGSTALPELAGKANDPWCARPAAELTRWQRTCGPRRRLDQPALVAAIEAALAQVLGAGGPWVDGIADPLIFFSANGRALAPEPRRRAVAELRERLKEWGSSTSSTHARPRPAPAHRRARRSPTWSAARSPPAKRATCTWSSAKASSSIPATRPGTARATGHRTCTTAPCRCWCAGRTRLLPAW